MNKIDIADLDVIFLTYDEPKKEEHWLELRNCIPWVKRVDGIRGSDTAHKAAAAASNTQRFIVIDGDNKPDPEFFKKTLLLDSSMTNTVFRWKARNHINGLVYGNGGISCWTKNFVQNMRTHENSDGGLDTQIEFCYQPDYVSMHDCYSVTYPNASPFQAWRAGFREGVKLCLQRGGCPDLQNYERQIYTKNLSKLQIWHSVGRDVENGWWAIYGARLGTYLTLLRQWDYTKVHDFDELKSLWSTFSKDTDDANISLGKTLKNKLNLTIVELDKEQSEFFKSFYKDTHKNKDIMAYEKSL
jgi:hypothetical protein